MKVKKTTYKVQGIDQPCIEVSDDFVTVRIAKFYHLIGKDTLILSEYLDGEWNSEEEVTGDFDSLTEKDAISIAKKFSVYLSD